VPSSQPPRCWREADVADAAAIAAVRAAHPVRWWVLLASFGRERALAHVASSQQTWALPPQPTCCAGCCSARLRRRFPTSRNPLRRSLGVLGGAGPQPAWEVVAPVPVALQRPSLINHALADAHTSDDAPSSSGMHTFAAGSNTATNASRHRRRANWGSGLLLRSPPPPLLAGSLRAAALDRSPQVAADVPLSHFVGTYRASVSHMRQLDLALLAALSAFANFWVQPSTQSEIAGRGAANVLLLLCFAFFVGSRNPFRHDESWKLYVRVGSLLLAALAAILAHVSLALAQSYGDLSLDSHTVAVLADAGQRAARVAAVPA